MSRRWGIPKAMALLWGAALALSAAGSRAEEFNPETHVGPLPAETRSSAEIEASSKAGQPGAGRILRLDLRTAVDLALSRNPTIRDFREKMSEADAIFGVAMASAFPVLNATASWLQQKDPLTVGNPAFGGEPFNNFQFGFKFDQSLYSGWSLWSGLRDAKYEKELRGYDLRAGERDLSVQVLQAYYSVLLAQHKLQSLERNMDIQNDLLKLTRHRQAIGRSQLLDVLQIQTQIAQLLPQIEQAKNSIRTNTATLAGLLYEEDTTVFRLPDNLLPIDASALLDRSKSAREPLPELERAQGVRDQFEEKRTETLAKFHPTLDLVGTWGRQATKSTDVFSQDSTAWILGLQLVVPITTAAASVFERRQLASQAAQLELQQAGAISAKSLTEVTSREALVLAQSNMAAYREAYRLAGKSLAEARRQYRLSTIDYQQFLTTESSYFSAEVAYEQSTYDTISAAASYSVAAGIPLKYLFQILGVSQS